MVDRGVNGGLACADMRIIQKTDQKTNIFGIDDHELTGLDVVTDANLFDTQKQSVIGIFHEYAHLAKGRSIMLLDTWNGSSSRLMTDPRLLEVLRELKPLIDMFSHSQLNLVGLHALHPGLY